MPCMFFNQRIEKRLPWRPRCFLEVTVHLVHPPLHERIERSQLVLLGGNATGLKIGCYPFALVAQLYHVGPLFFHFKV